jgi:hypothetical protein
MERSESEKKRGKSGDQARLLQSKERERERRLGEQ